MDTSDYNDKIQHLLSDENTYKKVKTDPTNNVLKITSDLIKKHSEALNLDVKTLIPSCAKPPKLYGLPKIHKPDAPLRPIFSQIDTPTYKLAQHVAKVLSPLRGHTGAHTRDSYHFVSEIKDLQLADNETMMTRQQLKNSGKVMKKSCMPKNDVTEEEVGDIEKGKFIESRNVMCYIACIYAMTQVVKNNKLSHEAVIKQVDVMFPQEMRSAVKEAVVHCKDVGKKYKDLCEASYWTAKCMYDFDSENFVFP